MWAVAFAQVGPAPIFSGHQVPAKRRSAVAFHFEAWIAAARAVIVRQFFARVDLAAGNEGEIVAPPEIRIAAVIPEVIWLVRRQKQVESFVEDDAVDVRKRRVAPAFFQEGDELFIGHDKPAQLRDRFPLMDLRRCE